MNHLYLYVALIGVVLVLFALTRNGKKSSATPVATSVPSPVAQAALEREVKATLDEFMSDFERENAQLLQTFAQLRSDSRQQLQVQQELIRDLEQRVAHLELKLEEQTVLLAQVSVVQMKIQQEPTPAAVVEQAPAPEPSKPAFAFNEKYAKVVELSRQGLTAEQIARETDIGLGEIHFVLGLAKQEES